MNNKAYVFITALLFLAHINSCQAGFYATSLDCFGDGDYITFRSVLNNNKPAIRYLSNSRVPAGNAHADEAFLRSTGDCPYPDVRYKVGKPFEGNPDAPDAYTFASDKTGEQIYLACYLHTWTTYFFANVGLSTEFLLTKVGSDRFIIKNIDSNRYLAVSSGDYPEFILNAEDVAAQWRIFVHTDKYPTA